MKKIILLLAFMFIFLGVFSQVRQTKRNFVRSDIAFRDNFSDADIGSTHPREWQIKDGEYIIGEEISADAVLRSIKVGTKTLEHTVDGSIYTSVSTSYGTFEYSIKPTSDGYTYFNFVSDMSGYNKYNVQISTKNAVIVVGFNAGSAAIVMRTANGYVEDSVWYRFKMERTYANKLTLWIKGGAFGNIYTLVNSSVSGANPTVDASGDHNLTGDIIRFVSSGTGHKITDIVWTKPDPFVFELTVNMGDIIILPLVDTCDYDFEINWGDGVIDRVQRYDDYTATHTYTNSGEYPVSIQGKCEGFDATESVSFQGALTNINEWGDVGFQRISFQGCGVLTHVRASTPPDLSNVVSLRNIFANCYELLEIDVSDWDLSACTSMQSAFANNFLLTTIDVSRWDVSNVENFLSAFYNSSLITELDFSNWDTSGGTDCRFMCYGCTSLASAIPATPFWDRVPAWALYVNAFTSSVNIANWADIPNGWK